MGKNISLYAKQVFLDMLNKILPNIQLDGVLVHGAWFCSLVIMFSRFFMFQFLFMGTVEGCYEWGTYWMCRRFCGQTFGHCWLSAMICWCFSESLWILSLLLYGMSNHCRSLFWTLIVIMSLNLLLLLLLCLIAHSVFFTSYNDFTFDAFYTFAF